MRTDHAVTRTSNERVPMRPIVDRQTTVKTLPPLAVSNNNYNNVLLTNSSESMIPYKGDQIYYGHFP